MERERTDDELLAAMVAGDPDGFSAFYRRHLPAVTAFFARRVTSREAAFDLTAETFAAVVVAVGRFDPARGPAIGWLLGIARHKLTDSVRRNRVEDDARRRLALEPVEIVDADLESIELHRHGPDLVDLLGALPAPYRDAVMARVVEERTYPELAVALGCSEAVVRQRVHRGLRRLRKQLEEMT